jgi:imidazolonepropionase-like amidohydrolase
VTTPLILTNARIVDSRGEVTASADVRIEGSVITHVGEVELTPGATVIDAAEKTVCPGLMNAHVHVCFDGSADPESKYQEESDVETALSAMPRLVETLRRGVTTVRDLGGKADVALSLSKAIDRGDVIGPRIVAAGQVITTPSGHGHWMGLEIDGVDQALEATKAMIRAGVGVVKVMATAGMMTSGQIAGAPQLTVDEMKACVGEAHKAGVPIAAHVESRQGAANAIEAGVDSIEHGHGLDDELLIKMVQDGVSLVPTIACDRAITQLGPAAGVPRFIVDDCARLAPSLERALRRAIDLGVTVAAGNDGGAPLTHPGDIVDELEVYVEMGMTPQAALTAATTSTAALLGLTGVGLVETGHRADLVIVTGDPLASIGALRNPETVIAAGRVLLKTSQMITIDDKSTQPQRPQ